MIIIPAIDMIGGKPVRLYKGDYAQKEEVGEKVLECAKTFEQQGATFLHMVDLDGAKAGVPVNQETILEVMNQTNLSIQIGGGIRTMQDIAWYIDAGASRVILGTSAIENPRFLEQALETYGEKIAVGIDCKDGYAYGRGWLQASKLHYIDFAKQLEAKGVTCIIVTDISRDGTLEGVNVAMLEELQKHVSMNIVASGGIKDIEDIKQLRNINLYGVIIGKALYHGAIDLNEALERAK